MIFNDSAPSPNNNTFYRYASDNKSLAQLTKILLITRNIRQRDLVTLLKSSYRVSSRQTSNLQPFTKLPTGVREGKNNKFDKNKPVRFHVVMAEKKKKDF